MYWIAKLKSFDFWVLSSNSISFGILLSELHKVCAFLCLLSERLYYFICRATSVLKAPSKLNTRSLGVGREAVGSGQKGFNKRRGKGGSVLAFQESSREPLLMRFASHRSIWGFSVDRGSHVCSCLACFKLASPLPSLCWHLIISIGHSAHFYA